ncbi:MAG TPA: PEP-CTERM sorting domain-containing protein [Chthoniobacteraceae bacterium]
MSTAFSQIDAAALVPLEATGWNQDIVIGAGETTAGRTATMDDGVGGGRDTWYGVGRNSAAPSTGLPVGPTTSQTTPDLTFTLQPFSASNAVFNGGTLLLATPTPLLRLALIGSSGGQAANLTVTVNFADTSTQVFNNLGGSSVNSDWFNGSPVAYTANGRITTGDGSFNNVNANNPRLYQSIFTIADSTKNVVSVTIANAAGNGGKSAIMAISGEAIPEPSTVGLLGLAALGLVGRRRRA